MVQLYRTYDWVILVECIWCLYFGRSPNAYCTGTDLNRNWGYHWNDGGSSSNPCSDSYMGTSAFSEVENRNVRDFLTQHKNKIKYYVNIHSYSQLVLLPWGFTEDPMPDYDRYLEVANEVYFATILCRKFYLLLYIYIYILR